MRRGAPCGRPPAGLEPPRDKLWFSSPLRASTGCSQELLQQLYDMLLPYDVVGVQTFHGLFSTSQVLAGPMECDEHSGGGDAGDQGETGERGGSSADGGSSANSNRGKGSMCCDAFQRASGLLRKSKWVLDTAQEFVEARIGKGARFVAAHVRPYPDPCVRTWALGAEELRRVRWAGRREGTGVVTRAQFAVLLGDRCWAGSALDPMCRPEPYA